MREPVNNELCDKERYEKQIYFQPMSPVDAIACQAEYREGFTECADCRVPLVPELPCIPHSGNRSLTFPSVSAKALQSRRPPLALFLSEKSILETP